MSKRKRSSSGGGGVSWGGCLALIFITLKIFGLIDWSWVWVLSPIWISIVFIVVIVLIAYIIDTIIKHID